MMEQTPFRLQRRTLILPLLFQPPGNQQPGQTLIRMLTALRLNLHANPARQVRGPHCRVGFINVLPTRAGRAQSLETNLIRLYVFVGEKAMAFSERWCGTLLWICTSPYRPHHGRKNWYVGIGRFSADEHIQSDEIRFETLRSSGPGGQHVNKTDSAVRATHLASGISVKVQSERSQHANKRLARLLIAWRLEQQRQNECAALKSERRLFHHQIERGNPLRIFKGMAFTPQ